MKSRSVLLIALTVVCTGLLADRSLGFIQDSKAVILAGRTYNIPNKFISGKPSEMVISEGVVIQYILPDFKARKALSHDEEKIALKENITGGALLESAKTRPAINEMVVNRRKLLAIEKDLGSRYGLHAYEWYLDSKTGPRLRHTVYLEKDEAGKVLSFIECGADKSNIHDYSSSCSDRFIVSGILYSHTYNKKKYLHDWKERRKSLLYFVSRFEVKK